MSLPEDDRCGEEKLLPCHEPPPGAPRRAPLHDSSGTSRTAPSGGISRPITGLRSFVCRSAGRRGPAARRRSRRGRPRRGGRASRPGALGIDANTAAPINQIVGLSPTQPRRRPVGTAEQIPGVSRRWWVRRLMAPGPTPKRRCPQRFHDLRHATASVLAAEGVPIWIAMEFRGTAKSRPLPRSASTSRRNRSGRP